MKTALKQYIRIQEIAREDPEYCGILEDLTVCGQALPALLARLDEKDRMLILEYLGLYGELCVRLAEIACMNMVFRE